MRSHFEKYVFLQHILVFLIISLQYMQKHITAAGSKLLRRQNYYIIHV